MCDCKCKPVDFAKCSKNLIVESVTPPQINTALILTTSTVILTSLNFDMRCATVTKVLYYNATGTFIGTLSVIDQTVTDESTLTLTLNTAPLTGLTGFIFYFIRTKDCCQTVGFNTFAPST